MQNKEERVTLQQVVVDGSMDGARGCQATRARVETVA
jgi:hypothetical protein